MSLDPDFVVKSTVGLFTSGGVGALLINGWRRWKTRGDLRDARSGDLNAEAEKEKADAQLVTALNGVAERWVDRAERKLQEAEDTMAKLREELHRVRNELTKYKGMEVENARLQLRVSALEAENAELRATKLPC